MSRPLEVMDWGPNADDDVPAAIFWMASTIDGIQDLGEVRYCLERALGHVAAIATRYPTEGVQVPLISDEEDSLHLILLAIADVTQVALRGAEDAGILPVVAASLELVKERVQAELEARLS